MSASATFNQFPAATVGPTGTPAGSRVLVLMATYNGASWVEAQLRSILSQQDVQITLVVSDDGSTDETVAIVQSVPTDRDVKLRRSAQPTGSAARNFFSLMQSADVSEQDFVAFADQDDIWQPKKLRRAIETLVGTGASGYSAAVRAFWADGRVAVLRQESRQTSADYLFEGAGQGCTFVLTAAFFATVQCTLKNHRVEFEALHYHDWAVYALCRINEERWVYDPWVCLSYRQHASNDTGARWGFPAFKRRLDLIRSGWYGMQINAVAKLCLAAGNPDLESPASAYLQLTGTAGGGLAGRVSLCGFVLRAGRRRLSDRLTLAIAAIGGYLTPARLTQ